MTLSGRTSQAKRCALSPSAALCFGISSAVLAADQPLTNAPAMTPTPSAAPAKGEFDNSCTMGLASGQVVKTDCSVNWTAPDGKVYCFSTQGSKQAFLKSPREYPEGTRVLPCQGSIGASRSYGSRNRGSRCKRVLPR
jgi:hypothetical protein